VTDPTVRPATSDEFVPVVRVLDAGLLDYDTDRLKRRLASGAVLVATVDDRVVGTLVLGRRPDWLRVAAGEVRSATGESAPAAAESPDDDHPCHVVAVAVSPSRRGQGVGTALVAAARDRVAGALTADFPERVRPFYETLDCTVRSVTGPEAETRLVAVWDSGA
jgi:GNAT superfamily N-acetyltransferase